MTGISPAAMVISDGRSRDGSACTSCASKPGRAGVEPTFEPVKRVDFRVRGIDRTELHCHSRSAGPEPCNGDERVAVPDAGHGTADRARI